MADKKINIGLGFNVDKTNLNTLKTELQSLLNMTTDDLIKIGSENAVADLKEIQTAASAVQSALEKSFNPKLNTQDLTKFQQELKLSGQSISSIKAGFDKAGASGQNAFRNITAELLTTNRQLKQSNQWLDKMAETMANTVRWTIASSALNAVTGSVQKAYSFTKQLDTSLNDIRIVTGKSADEMARLAKEATTAAKNLGSTTTAYTKAALIYEQQGLGEADVAARTDVTTKVSNVTGQGAADVSEQLTAIWNGYKVSAAEAELYIDKVSAVAATTAADLEELSEGMGKVASAANSMGVDIDQLNASLATIISVTRQDASAVGTSLKTIYARMGDLAVDGEDEFGVKLGDVSSKLKTMGIDILDAQGQMREMGEVIEEVAEKWDTWTRAQQQAAAVALAGKRQYNNLIALFENWDMYEEAKSTSQGGAGELQKQQDIYMESMEAHLNQLQAEAEELYQTLLDPEGLNPLIDALTSIVGLAENLIESLGGGAGLLTTLGSIGLNVFSNQITKGITTTIHNITGFKDNLKQAAAEAALINELQITNPEDERQQKILDIAKQRLGIMKSMSEEEYRLTNDTLKQTNELYKQKDALDAKQAELVDIVKTHTNIKLELDKETGAIKNSTEAIAALQSQLTNGFADSKDAGMKAITGIEELVSLTEDVERKQKSVSSRKGKVTQFSNQQKDAAQEHTIAISADMVTAEEQEMAALAQDRLRESTDKLEKAQNDLARSQDYLKQSQDAVSAASNNSAESIAALLDQIEKEFYNEDYSIDQKKELLEIQRALTNAFDKDGKIHTKNSDVVKAAADAVKKYNVTIKKQESSIKLAVKELDTFNNKLKENKQRTEEAETKLKELKKSFDLTKAVQNITSLVGGVANLGNGIKTLAGLGDIWSNEDLTAGERLLQTFTSLSFALPQIITPINQARAAMQAWLKQDEAWVAIQTTKQFLNKAEIVDLQSASYWKGIYKIISSQLTNEEKKHFAALMLKAKAGDEAAINEMKQIASEKLHGASLKTLTARFKEMGIAAWQSLGPYLPIVLAVVAAIGVLTAAVVLGTKAWNADAEAAKKAAEAAKALGEEYKQTKAAYEELKQSISDYKEEQTAIDELTVGTEEWRDAIQDANDKVLELIQNYPILAKYMSNENGRLVISDEGLEAVEQQKREAVTTAFQKSTAAQQIANDARLKSQATDLGRKAQYITGDSYALGTLKTKIAPWAIIESSIKGDWYLYDKATTSDEIQDIAARAQLSENADMWSSYTEFSNALEGYSKRQIDALWENSDELKTLCEEIHANTKMNDVLNATLIQTELADNQDYQNSEFQEGINQILEAERKKVEDEALKKYNNKAKGNEWGGRKALMQEYADRMIASGKWKAEDVQVKRNKIIVAGQDKFIKDWDTVAELLAKEDAWNSIGSADISKLNEEIQKSVNSLGVFGKTLTQGAEKSKNVSEATSADYKKAQDALKNGLKDFTGDLDALGYEKLSELEAALKKSVEDYEATSATILANLDDRVEKLLYNKDGTFVIDGLTLDQQRNYGKQMEAVYNKYGDSGVTDFNELFTSLGDKGIELAAAMSEVDSIEELDEFKKMLQEQGSLSEDAAESLVTTLQFSLGLFEEYSREAAQAAAASLNKVLNSVKNIGDTISSDDYDKLGEGMKKFFSVTSEGMYALNIAATEFAKQARISILADRENKIKIAHDKYETSLATYNEAKSKATRASDIVSDANMIHAAHNNYSKYTDPGGTVVVGINSDNATDGDFIINNDVAEANRNLDIAVNPEDVEGMLNLIRLYGSDEVNKTITKDVEDDVRDGKGTMLFGDFKALHEAYWKVYNGYYNISALEEASNTANTNLTNATIELNNAKTQFFDTYKDLAAGATKEELEDWVGKGYISLELAQQQDYRFNIELDFGVDPLEELDKAFDESGKRVDKLKEKTENLFGDALKINLQAQTTELRNGFDILSKKATELSNKTKFEGTSYNSVKSAFADVVSSEDGGLGIALGDLSTYYDAETGRFTNLAELENIVSGSGKVVSTADRAMVQNLFDAINAHNTDIDTLLATTDSIEEQNQLLKENALAILDHDFKTAHEINEIKKSYNDFMKEFTVEEDNYFEQLEYDINNYKVAFDDVGQSMAKIEELAKATFDIAEEGYVINGRIFTQEELRAAILEEGVNLQEYALSLKESLTNLQELEIAQIEEIAKQYDNIVGYAESWNELLEHELTLQQLIHGENYAITKDIYEAQISAVQSQLATQQHAYEYWKQQLANTSENDNAYETYRTNMLEAGKQVAATSAELGQMLYDNFERAWNSHFDGFDRARTEYEWISSQAERTFDTITGALESQKLINDWTKTMNETLDENAQKRMKEFIDLQEEKLKNLRTEGKLSQYNLDLAQAEFDLLQAQIALEDARNNKTQMRLTRGADGAYSYQYVADNQVIVDAESKVAEAAQAIMQTNKDAFTKGIDTFNDDLKDFQERYLELAQGDFDSVELEELSARWGALGKNRENLNQILQAARESMQEAAKATGLQDYENLSDEELLALLPEANSRYFKMIQGLASGDFNTVFGDDIEKAKAMFEELGLLAPSGIKGSDNESLMNEIHEVLAGLTADELSNLGESVAGLEQISVAADKASESFENFAYNIKDVITDLKNLGIEKNAANWDGWMKEIYGASVIPAGNPKFTYTGLGENIATEIATSMQQSIDNFVQKMGNILNESSTTTSITENNSTTTNHIEMTISLPNVVDTNAVYEAINRIISEAEQADAENNK